MRIFDTSKTYELLPTQIDYDKGYLVDDKKFVMRHDAILAQDAVYIDRVERLNNGSTQIWKDLKTPAVEAKEAYDEYEDIQVYVLYTEAELAQREITQLKQKLTETDYQAIKYAEGELSEYEYAPIKAQRSEWRRQINELEKKI